MWVKSIVPHNFREAHNVPNPDQMGISSLSLVGKVHMLL